MQAADAKNDSKNDLKNDPKNWLRSSKKLRPKMTLKMEGLGPDLGPKMTQNCLCSCKWQCSEMAPNLTQFQYEVWILGWVANGRKLQNRCGYDVEKTNFARHNIQERKEPDRRPPPLEQKPARDRCSGGVKTRHQGSLEHLPAFWGHFWGHFWQNCLRSCKNRHFWGRFLDPLLA